MLLQRTFSALMLLSFSRGLVAAAVFPALLTRPASNPITLQEPKSSTTKYVLLSSGGSLFNYLVPYIPPAPQSTPSLTPPRTSTPSASRGQLSLSTYKPPNTPSHPSTSPPVSPAPWSTCFSSYSKEATMGLSTLTTAVMLEMYILRH